MCTGVRYLGGFIIDDESKCDKLKEKTDTWEQNIHTIKKIAGKHPQEGYSTLVCTIQLERIFVQHVTKNTGDMLMGVEKMLQENFCLDFSP